MGNIADEIRIHHDPAQPVDMVEEADSRAAALEASTSLTLYDIAKLSQDQILAGCLENICTTNRIFEVLPFVDVIDPMRSVQNNFVSDTAQAPIIQVQLPDTPEVRLALSSKQIGRSFCEFLAVELEDGGGDVIKRLKWPGPPSITFNKLDDMLAEVRAGVVDYIMMHQSTIRAVKALQQGSSGAAILNVIQLPSGAVVPTYRGTPVYRNDYMTENRAVAGTFYREFDDGSEPTGLAGYTGPIGQFFSVNSVGGSSVDWRLLMRTGIMVLGDGQCVYADFT